MRTELRTYVTLRTSTCMFLIMSGDVSENDVKTGLQQMQAMKLKIVLLQNENETSLNYFDVSKFKAPILKYYSDKTRINYVSQ